MKLWSDFITEAACQTKERLSVHLNLVKVLKFCFYVLNRSFFSVFFKISQGIFKIGTRKRKGKFVNSLASVGWVVEVS